MTNGMMFDLAAVVTLLPVAWLSWRQPGEGSRLFWGVVGLAIAGPLVRVAMLLGHAWQTSLGAALWVSIAASMIVFAGVITAARAAWRLLPLLMPYLMLLGLIATLGQKREGGTLAPAPWLEFHIVVSVTTYAVLTIAAVAALAAFLQERELKAKRSTMLSRLLPSVAEAEALSGRLLVTSQVVLGLGLVSGMAVQYLEMGVLLRLDHKTLLSLLAFAVIGLLLLVRRLIGVRGRVAARGILLAYLLLTLAYPGVKFVTDVLLQRGGSAGSTVSQGL
ncbi:MAG: hypothetical protein FD153_585 [Rhodospirillaceae bacterium]|nr:MAG: hypothetical protein FD153_585 [Rhodospirillaceae bacterium]